MVMDADDLFQDPVRSQNRSDVVLAEGESRRYVLSLRLRLFPCSHSSAEKTLQSLRKEQRQKVEDFKKKTKYYETRNLLEQFDESAAGTPKKATLAPNATPNRTPQRPVIQTPGMTPANKTKGGAKVPPHLAGKSRPRTILRASSS